jgi:hypothetical protein
MEAFEGEEGLKIQEGQDEAGSLADCNSVGKVDGCMMAGVAVGWMMSDIVDSKMLVIVIAMQVVSKQVCYKHYCKDLDGIVTVTVAGKYVADLEGCNTLVVSMIAHTVNLVTLSEVLLAIDSTLKREDKSPQARIFHWLFLQETTKQ